MTTRRKDAGLWIVRPWEDLALFVLSPLWVIALLWMAMSRFDPNGFGSIILAVGATGHHLPGFIRAYTDPVLFRRFQTRFILTPLVLLGAYVLFFALHLESLNLILILWGVWHGAMQVNGFLRIYDAKVGSFSAATSWLDWAMCIAWFGGGLLYSSRIIGIFSYFFNAGGKPISPAAFVSFRYAWMTVLAGVTVAFLVNAYKQTRAGLPPSPVKLLMMASSFAFWWFAMVNVSSVLVGVLLFEIVHDIQYNALVWVYNKRRVSQRMTASRIEKFLFRPGMARPLLYVALILAYGSLGDALNYVNIQAPSVLQAGVNTVGFWSGLFMVSTFLHFYFDGFIWQVRENAFRQGLGIGNGGKAAQQTSRTSLAGWLPAGWKWAFFLVPAAVLAVSEYRRVEMPLVDQARNVAQLLPDRWQANAVAGSLEKVHGNESQAIGHLQRAVALNPSYAYGETMLADLYSHRGESELALQHYFKAVELNPGQYDIQNRLGKMLVNKGRNADAIPHLLIAAEHRKGDADLAYVLGASLVHEKRAAEGIPHLRRAVQLDPRHKQAFNYLGIALQTGGNLKEAANCYRRALEIDSTYPAARQNLERAERMLSAAKE